MIASRVTLDTLRNASTEIGVTVDISSMSLTRHRVKLYPDTPQALYRPACKRCRDRIHAQLDRSPYARPCRCRRWPDERGDSRYQRTSADGNGRRVNAVCWHGFRDFFRAVYRVEPLARFATAMDTWRNADDFEARFRESGHRNIGSQMCPMAAAEACRCPESGYIGHLGLTESRPLYIRTGPSTTERRPDPVSLTTADMGTDDVLVQPDGITVERWADYNRKMNDLLMRRS